MKTMKHNETLLDDDPNSSLVRMMIYAVALKEFCQTPLRNCKPNSTLVDRSKKKSKRTPTYSVIICNRVKSFC